MTVFNVTLTLSIALCGPTALYLNFLGSQPSLAAQMSSSRSAGKVCSTSWKSECMWRASTCHLRCGRGGGGCQAAWAAFEQIGTCVVGAFLTPPCLQCSQKPVNKWGWGEQLLGVTLCCMSRVFPRVLQSVVLLSDSQLHLFLQSQLSVPEIEACVQGRSPMTVSDAILHYAMSNCGWVQEERRGSSHLAKGDQPKR